MIKRFKEIGGLYIEKIYGQDRFAYKIINWKNMC